jgi:hypothetical protein
MHDGIKLRLSHLVIQLIYQRDRNLKYSNKSGFSPPRQNQIT